MTGNQVTADRPTGDFPDAACLGRLDLFFEPDGMEPRYEREYRENKARSLCRVCPHQQACLDGAMQRRESHGIWGTYTAAEIRRMARRRARAS